VTSKIERRSSGFDSERLKVIGGRWMLADYGIYWAPPKQGWGLPGKNHRIDLMP